MLSIVELLQECRARPPVFPSLLRPYSWLLRGSARAPMKATGVGSSRSGSARALVSSGESGGDGQQLVRESSRALVKAAGIGSSRSEKVLELW